MSIVIYGGAFNPPLNSHFAIAEQLMNQYVEIEKVIFVPVGKTYGKPGLIENEHRYKMLEAVINKNEKFELSDIEMKQSYVMNTIETMDKMQEEYKNEEIYFLTGSDNLKELSTWPHAQELLSRYKIIAKTRENDNIQEIIENDELLKKYKEQIRTVNEEIRSNYSSTYVRKQIKEQKSVRYLMPDEVYEYIKQNQLYRR